MGEIDFPLWITQGACAAVGAGLVFLASRFVRRLWGKCMQSAALRHAFYVAMRTFNHKWNPWWDDEPMEQYLSTQLDALAIRPYAWKALWWLLIACSLAGFARAFGAF